MFRQSRDSLRTLHQVHSPAGGSLQRTRERIPRLVTRFLIGWTPPRGQYVRISVIATSDFQPCRWRKRPLFIPGAHVRSRASLTYTRPAATHPLGEVVNPIGQAVYTAGEVGSTSSKFIIPSLQIGPTPGRNVDFFNENVELFLEVQCSSRMLMQVSTALIDPIRSNLIESMRVSRAPKRCCREGYNAQ